MLIDDESGSQSAMMRVEVYRCGLLMMRVEVSVERMNLGAKWFRPCYRNMCRRR